jgi:hypothetical protein
MQSIAASPESAIDLIMKVGEITAEASALVAGALTCPELEVLRAALGNLADGLMEAAAALRAKEVSAHVLILAREAGETGEYERGREDGRREGYAGRRGRSRHLALAAS